MQTGVNMRESQVEPEGAVMHNKKWNVVKKNTVRPSPVAGTRKKKVGIQEPASKTNLDSTGQPNVYYHGPTLREIIPQIMNEQNRKRIGTWQRKFDFTRTIIGYLLGIHNFFRFPYLCYVYGGVFFIPYIIMMICVGAPAVFMEFTIGQYYGVGSYIAFTHMSPILSCVSKLLTWSCVVNCWMIGVILAWLRVYASDSTSCVRGWEVCNPHYYYSSPHCYTGIADDNCNDPELAAFNNLTELDVMSQDMLHYNFKCRSVQYYCEQQGWKVVPGRRRCVDENGTEHTIYERRYHAIQEYLYGAVFGFQRKMEYKRKQALMIEAGIEANNSEIDMIFGKIYMDACELGDDEQTIKPEQCKYNGSSRIPEVGSSTLTSHLWNESARIYMKKLAITRNDTQLQKFNRILDKVAGPEYQTQYWEPGGQKLTESLDSSSYRVLQQASVTIWITIAVFLFEDLLKISFLSYVLNALPFLILIYITIIAACFEYSWHGVQHVFKTNQSFFEDLKNVDMWADAVIQVIYTSGIGNGVLISLATFNNFDNSYTFDLYCTLGLSIVTSICGVIICFSSIGHYLKFYDIDVPFQEYIKSDSTKSSVEFCFIAFSHFLTILRNKNVTALWFFFMVSTFATDQCIRLVQNVLDAIPAIAPRLKNHSTMVLVVCCIMGYLLLVPVLKNGGLVLFIDFEYYSTKFMIPTIVAIEIGVTIFIYKATRLVDNAEHMGVFSSYTFRVIMIALMYSSFFLVVIAVIINIFHHVHVRFNGAESESFSELFGIVFCISPFLMAILSVIKQLIVVPSKRWRWLFVPLKGKDRKVQRAFLRRMQHSSKRQDNPEATDQEQIRAAAQRMRILESRFILAMMEKRREMQRKKFEEENNNEEGEDAGQKPPQSLPPLFASLVRIAAAEFAARKQEEEELRKRDPNVITEASSDENNGEINIESESQNPKWDSSLKATLIRLKNRIVSLMKAIGATMKTWLAKMKTACTWKELKKRCQCKKHDAPLTKEDLEERLEQKRIYYLNIMDHIERWPGRLDESEIESEGSSIDDDSDEEAGEGKL